MSESRIVVSVASPGTYRVAVRASRYWQPSAGCATKGHDGMIRWTIPRAGRQRLSFSPGPEKALAALTGGKALSCAHR